MRRPAVDRRYARGSWPGFPELSQKLPDLGAALCDIPRVSGGEHDEKGACRTARQPATAAPQPELPAWKAFVVQFSRETGSESGSCSGRVEHLSSGRRARFASAEELLAVLLRLLDELGEAPC